ncbi:MAG: penicillin-binding protein [Patescibacteria group bacterium]|nr:penicillin-binding protein [Patescibacteria group bacterium]
MPIPQLKPKKKFTRTWRQNTKLKKKKKRKKWFDQFLNNWLPILAILIILGGLAMLGVFAWFSRDLPSPDKLIERSIAQSTKIYARDAKTVLYEIHGDERRTMINLEEISEKAKWAHIAIEDKDFYEHKGFSLPRIFKALWIDILKRKKAQGASTITQQFVKNAILTNEKSWTRKIKEIVLAYQIERKFSKEEILKMYFNEIPYGSNIYGIEAAAESFFGKNAKDLTIAEGALLASIPKATTYYSPYGSHTDTLLDRQKLVIDLMAKQEQITEKEAQEAKKVDILSQVKPRQENILAPHFVMYVREILAEKYGVQEIEQGGLKVVTTLDYDLQKIAEEEIDKGISKIERYGGSNAALVSLEVKTGEILAMVGSHDYFNTDIDGNVNVTLRERQPGSSFKPIVYTQALEDGYTPETMLFDLVTTFKTSTKDYIPKNYSLNEHGPVTMRQALQASLNIPAVKTLYLTGVDDVLDLAEELGYTTLSDRSRFGLSLVLGGGEVKLIEHLNAYATLAREGKKIPYYPILRIEDNQGKILEKRTSPKEVEVIDQQVARQMNKILSDNTTRASFWGYTQLALSGHPVCAKTGTTNDYRDAWTLGYTPSLATGVWAGNNDNSEMKRGAAGLVLATPIWNGFMKRALEGQKVEYFPDFKAIDTGKAVLKGKLEADQTVKIDKITGKKIPNSCLEDWPEEFIAEETVKSVHNILHYVKKNDPRGDFPENPKSDPQYETWEAPVQTWAQENDYLNQMPQEESCSLRAEKSQPEINFSNPEDDESITNSETTFKVETDGKYNIVKVEYYIDENKIGQSKKSPFSYSHNLSGLSQGYHDITAKVFDKYENSTQKTITVNINLSQTSSSLYFISPSQNSTHYTKDLPLSINVFAYDPEDVSSVTIYYRANSQNNQIEKINTPKNNNLTFSWEEPEPGTYKLFVVMTNKEEEITQSDYLTINIKE